MNQANHHSLLVTAGGGPDECNQAVGHVLDRMKSEATDAGLSLVIHRSEGRYGPKSAVVVVYGGRRQIFVDSWCGTVQWRMQSLLRRHHKRSNWFIGIFELELHDNDAETIHPADVTFSTLRAGGPGGQHQNTTDSAVRATHSKSGLTVVARGARSQHRNKALALDRLQSLANAQIVANHEQYNCRKNQLHRALERGNPIRKFDGLRFKEGA